MKMFTKLALVSSMAISANAMAMQSMDDAALSATTGQDGINIGIGISKVEIEKVLVHDNDGLNYAVGSWVGNAPTAPGQAGYGGVTGTSTGPGTPPVGGTRAGAIVIKANGSGKTATNGIVIEAPVNAAGNDYDTTRKLPSGLLAQLEIDTDAGAGGGNTAFLNVAAKVSGLDIYIGEIGVAASNAVPASNATTIRRGATDSAYHATNNPTGNYNKILSGLSLKTGIMNANIQLGAAPQGAMIVLNTSMVGGLEIKDLGILDNSTVLGNGDGSSAANRAAGEIRIDSIKVADANSTNLAVDAKVSVLGKTDTSNGYLRIVTGTGSSTPKTDMYIKGIHLGSATAGSIGDVEVQGLQTYYGTGTFGADVKGSMITISGH